MRASSSRPCYQAALTKIYDRNLKIRPLVATTNAKTDLALRAKLAVFNDICT